MDSWTMAMVMRILNCVNDHAHWNVSLIMRIGIGLIIVRIKMV